MADNPEKNSRSRVKGDKSQFETINSKELSNSSLKNLYSMPKSPRWSQPKRKLNEPGLYELPSVKSNRSASFGYGHKVDISKLANNSPPPNSYQVQSEFQLKKGKGIGMGLGREQIKAVSAFGEKPFSVPGVGSYLVKDLKSHQTVSFSGRVPDLSEKWIRQVPGPGTYQTLQLIDKNMKSSNSRFGNARSQKWSKAESRNEFQKDILRKNVPGPGQYISQKKTYDIIDRFMKQGGASFSKSSRPDIANKSAVPGPGSYRHPSQFIH